MSIDAFVEELGLIAAEENLPRIAGRIMGLMLVSGEALGFAEIAQRLQVSRASVSTNLRLLIEMGFIERAARPGDRLEYYRLRPSPYGRLLRGAIDRLERTQAAVEAVRSGAESLDPAVEERLAGLQDFYRAAADSLRQLVATYQAKD